MSRLCLLCLPLVCALFACKAPPTGQHGESKATDAPKTAPDKTAENTATAPANPAGAPSASDAPIGAGDHIAAEPAAPLTEAEKKLIAADPDTLSPEDRRKRAFALRKKVMQNPDSEAAQALLQARQAILDGQLDPDKSPTAAPAEGDAAGGMVIEAPEHLRK